MEASYRSEGDINLGDRRVRWQDEHLSAETLALLEADAGCFLHQSLSTPCLNTVESVDGIYLYDGEGRRYMDFHGNGAHQVGYRNRAVLDGIHAQLESLAFIPRRYTHEIAVKAAQKLIERTGGELTRVLFTPSGSLSIGLALKIIRKATGRHKTISLWDSFHGAGLDAISVGGEKMFRSHIGPLLPGAGHVMPYNSYRCVFGNCDDCGMKCLDYLDYVLEREGDVGAVLMEPIRATDVHVPPVSYFLRLREICDRHCVLLVFDEIPTAFGRTGSFFVHQRVGITPDILIIGKGIGAGVIPISAVLTKEELNIGQDVALGHYTHEKSALGCRAILETIDYIDRHNLMEHVGDLARLLIDELEMLKRRHPLIGDVRIAGILFAIELVTDRVTKEKASNHAESMLYACLSKGLSFKVSQGNILTFGPPLVITKEELLEALRVIDECLYEIGG